MFRCHPREMCWRPAQTSRWQLGEKLSWWMPRLTKKPGGRVGRSTKRSSLLLKRVPFKSFTVHHNPPVPTIYPGWIHLQFGSSRSWAVEISEAEKELDYKPTTSLQDGINKFIAWYLGSALDEADADDDDGHVIYPCSVVSLLERTRPGWKQFSLLGGAGQGPRFILKWICTYIIR